MGLYEKYYQYVLEEKPKDSFPIVERIVFEMVDEISGRSGMWEIDSDIQEEIMVAMKERVIKAMS